MRRLGFSESIKRTSGEVDLIVEVRKTAEEKGVCFRKIRSDLLERPARDQHTIPIVQLL